MEQQRPVTASCMPAAPASCLWFHSCMVRPTTLCPSARSMAATVEESTPPDMATAMVLLGMMAKAGLLADRSFIVNRRQFAETGDGCWNQFKSELHVFRCVLLTQTEADAGAGPVGG